MEWKEGKSPVKRQTVKNIVQLIHSYSHSF